MFGQSLPKILPADALPEVFMKHQHSQRFSCNANTQDIKKRESH